MLVFSLNRLAVAAAVVTVVALLGGVAVARERVRRALDDGRRDAVSQGEILANAMQAGLETVVGIGDAMRDLPQVQRLLAANGVARRVARLDPSLRRRALARDPDVASVSATLQANARAQGLLDAVWVMDTSGAVVASSDWDRPLSRLGRVYPDRAVVERSQQGELVQGYLPSVTTGRPGVVFEQPVVVEDRVVGSVVVRSEADALSALLRVRGGATVMVTDSVGRVQFSSDRRLLNRRVQWSAIAGAVVDSTLPTVQQVLGADFRSPGDDAILLRAWELVPLDRFGWTLHVVMPVEPARVVRRDTWITVALIWGLVLLALASAERSRRHVLVVADAERRALAEQNRVREILNTSYDAVVTLDAEGRIVDWNARAQVVFGYSAAEVVGRDAVTLLLPERLRAEAPQAFSGALHSPDAHGGRPREVSLLTQTGGELPVELSTNIILDASGRRLLVAFIRDISARRLQEKETAARAHRQDRYRAAAAEMREAETTTWSVGLTRLLEDTRRATASQRARYWSVLDDGQTMVVEQSVTASGREGDAEGTRIVHRDSPVFFRLVRRRETFTLPPEGAGAPSAEWQSSRPDALGAGPCVNAPVWFEGRLVGMVSIEDAARPRAWDAETVEFLGTVAAQIGTLLEAVRRGESERSLAEQRRRVDQILSRSPVPQALWEQQHGCSAANRAMQELFGFRSESDLQGRRLADFTPARQPDGRASAERVRELELALADHERASMELHCQRLDGSTFPAQLTLTRLEERDGLVFVVSLIDLSEVKAAQAAILAAKESAEQAEAAKTAFLATMSHEIRTPMNGVLAMTELLEQTPLSDDQRRMLEIVRGSGSALMTIINDILDFSKIEAGKLIIESTAYDPSQVVDEVAQLLASRAAEKELPLYVEVEPGVPAAAEGDPTRIRQVLLNLTGNAVKFTEQGYVRLTVRAARPDVLRFEVMDTGPGLTAEAQGRLFQPFMQADGSTARKFGGTGLGLSISRRLVELMGGVIGVDSAVSRGSIFWFEVPSPVRAPARIPDPPIADLAVTLVGFPDEQARILDAYVRAAGAQPARVESHGSAAIEHMELSGASNTVVVLAASGPGYPTGVGTALREIKARVKPPPLGMAVILPVAGRASGTDGALADGVATTTEPVRREAFWNLVAVAAGRARPLASTRPEVRPQVPHQAPDAEIAAARGAVILVAEDNRTNQIVIGRLLEHVGICHEIVANGREALDRLRARRARYGLLLTDYHMPVMDGFELAAEWRRIERAIAAGLRLPILALTADAMPGMAERCREAGMDGFLAKPLARATLVPELERWIPVAFELRRRATPTLASAAPSGTPRAGSIGAATDPVDLVTLAAQTGLAEGPELHDFLRSLWHSASSLEERLAEAAAAQDRARLRDAAHGGKGEAGAIAASALQRACAELQDAATTAPWPALTEMVASVIAEHRRVGEAIAALDA